MRWLHTESGGFPFYDGKMPSVEREVYVGLPVSYWGDISNQQPTDYKPIDTPLITLVLMHHRTPQHQTAVRLEGKTDSVYHEHPRGGTLDIYVLVATMSVIIYYVHVKDTAAIRNLINSAVKVLFVYDSGLDCI